MVKISYTSKYCRKKIGDWLVYGIYGEEIYITIHLRNRLVKYLLERIMCICFPWKDLCLFVFLAQYPPPSRRALRRGHRYGRTRRRIGCNILYGQTWCIKCYIRVINENLRVNATLFITATTGTKWTVNHATHQTRASIEWRTGHTSIWSMSDGPVSWEIKMGPGVQINYANGVESFI